MQMLLRFVSWFTRKGTENERCVFGGVLFVRIRLVASSLGLICVENAPQAYSCVGWMEIKSPLTTLHPIPPWENQLTSALTSTLRARVCICVSAELLFDGFDSWN